MNDIEEIINNDNIIYYCIIYDKFYSYSFTTLISDVNSNLIPRAQSYVNDLKVNNL